MPRVARVLLDPKDFSQIQKHNIQRPSNIQQKLTYIFKQFAFLFRLAKRLAALTIETTAPCTPGTSKCLQLTANESEWTPGQWLLQDGGSSQEEDEEKEGAAASLLPIYNETMATLSENTNLGKVSPLTFQLKTTWDKATEDEKEICIDKAIEGCSIVCNVIAPKAGEELLRSCTQLSDSESATSDLLTLIQAYKNAPTKSLKTQILSLYAYKYPVKQLQKLHKPYENITDWQIRKARRHARECGPGFAVQNSPSHRVRLPKDLLDHFIDFLNRPYFYQDVAFGTRKLKLDNGEKITMPNVIRTVTRSTMINQYIQFCEEEQVKPLSRSTLFRILRVRESSQQKSLCGVDDTAADGSSGFENISKIVDDLQQLGKEKTWVADTKKSLQDGKRYFKTEYRHHCQQGASECPDHCCKFALSDPTDENLQEQCTHEHNASCRHCDGIKVCLHEIEEVITSDSINFYSKEQKEDLLYDFDKAKKSIQEWKNHIMRSTNQERAKQDILKRLDSSSVLLVMDWAMKFLQLRYREKQSEWYGKRGLSWHISSVVSRDQTSGQLMVTSYAHLFDKCTQDWYAVASVIENLLQHLKTNNPKLCKVYLRSDEAGCYHCNNLIAAVRDIGERVGIVVENYDYSEPQCGKDICDRIICPMKTSIRSYCCEGHDILTACAMRNALQQHTVRGTSASVNIVNESQQSLSMRKLDHFSSFHNFQFEDSGIRAWKAYGIGQGKHIPYNTIYVKHQGLTLLQTQEGFFEPIQQRVIKTKQPLSPTETEEIPLFECQVPGCTEVFNSFSEMELHLDVGQHKPLKQETVYDRIRKDWAAKFASIDVTHNTDDAATISLSTETIKTTPLQMGWAQSKMHSGTTRFPPKVKEYLTKKFMLGERTGRKEDPAQVEQDMRNARNTSNERQFTSKEWLTKTQIKGFFSRLAASRRKNIVGLSLEEQEDVTCLVEDSERQELIGTIDEEIGLRHPITYDMYDLCDYYHQNKLGAFNVAMLKSICSHLEVQFKPKDKKIVLVGKLKEVISECQCVSSQV